MGVVTSRFNVSKTGGAPRVRGAGEFERALIRERTAAGLTAARSRGRVCGRWCPGMWMLALADGRIGRGDRELVLDRFRADYSDAATAAWRATRSPRSVDIDPGVSAAVGGGASVSGADSC